MVAGPRNQRNCAALANESGELPVNLEPDWRSCRNRMDQHGVGVDEEDPMINVLHRVIRGAVRGLAVLMVVIILWGVVDVGW